MLRRVATFFCVAFFWESEATRCFFLAAPFSSASTKDSEEEGDIKMLENVWESVLVGERPGVRVSGQTLTSKQLRRKPFSTLLGSPFP